MLKSIVDSAGLSAENVQNVVEMGNDLTDKLSEKVEEVGEEFDKLRSEMGKVISDIITPTEKLGHRIEDEVSEMIKETKEKLEDSVNNVDCAFSGMTSDVTFGDETQKIASENLGYINNEMNRIVEDIGKTIPEKADELEETSDKMERRTESVLEVINKKNELIENVGGIASEITTGFKELCEETVGNRLGEAVDKIHQFAENVDEAVSEKVSTFGSEISEKTSVKLEEGTEKMDELIKGTVEKFQELSEETNKKIVSVEESVREKVKGIKEGIDEKINEINVKMDNEEKDIMHGFDDGERQIVGMSDICVKEGNEDVKKDVLEANPITVTDDFLGVADIGYLQSSTFRKDTEKIKEIVPKSEHDDEAQAIKKIILPGEDVPEQVGTLSESGVYHDDYDMEEPKNIETAKLSDVVNHKADEVDSLLEEAFDFSKKLKEPETVDVVTDQGVCLSKFKFILS